jgi:hypothetical protein
VLDFDALRRQATEWLGKSSDLGEFSKAVESLKGVAEAEKASVDAKNLQHTWTTKVTALAPMFAAIITGLTFALTFVYQRQQAQTVAQQAEESQWRTALQKVDVNDPSQSEAGALAMTSFLDSPYSQQARSITAALACNIRHPRVFDVVFFELFKRTQQDNQSDLLDVAKTISMRVRKTYDDLPSTGKQKQTFNDFLIDPSGSFEMDKPDAYRGEQEVEAFEWELDTTSAMLFRLWTNPGGPSVKGADLRQIIFLNQDFRNFDSVHDLDQANMDRFTGFYGNCTLSLKPAAAGTGVQLDNRCPSNSKP